MNESTMEITKFLKILAGVLIFCGLIYFFTTKVVEKKKTSTPAEEITYNEIAGSTILTQSETEYYVILYKKTGDKKDYFNDFQNKYIENKKTPKLYFVNLDYAINKTFLATDKTVTTIKDITDLKINDGTLLTVKDKTITKVETTYEMIIKTLGL